MSGRYEVFAVRYGTRTMRRSEAFYRYSVYGEADGDQAIDYFFWVLRSDDAIWLVDCGFDPEEGRRRGRTVLVDPLDALASLGISPTEVSEIIISHGHYDHIGNLRRFPSATLTIARSELDLWTGPLAVRAQFAEPTTPGELAYLAEIATSERLRLVDGPTPLAPDLRVLPVGGHTPGQLVTVVEGGDRPIVLASDSLHFYEEMDRDRPFAILSDLAATYRAYDTLRELEASGSMIVAGHDPDLAARVGAANKATDTVIRLA